jgi:DNA segregation ATPase FtsK/SpoIIIE, S-DNA-T family
MDREEGRILKFPRAIEPGQVSTTSTTGSDLTPPSDDAITADALGGIPTVTMVDQPDDAVVLLPWQQDDNRRPVTPTILTKEHIGPAFRWYVGRATHAARFHAVRVLWYQTKATGYSPRGMLRIGIRVKDWVTVAEAQAIKAKAVRHAETNLKEAHDIYHGAERSAAPKARARRIVLGCGAVIAICGGAALWFYTPLWVFVLTMMAILDVLGYAGQSPDKPLIGPAVVSDKYVKLTSDIVVRALSSLGIAALSSKDAVITFPSPIQRDGEGWRAEVDLPHGTTATEVIKLRNKFASGLRRQLGCVWPEGDPDVHEGRLIVWVGDKDLARKGYVRWPLASRGHHDFFSRMPFGEEPRGRLVTLPVFENNILIGAIPGQGKTSAARCITCAEALDPTVELWIHELAGKGDYDPLEIVSHRFVSGIDDESIAYAAKSLRMLRTEAMRRVAALKALPRDICPDKKVTREIADKRSFKLWPLVAIFDECQNLFAHPDYGKQAGEDAEFVIRVGRAVALSLVLATQRPDKDALPTGVSGNVSIKFCLYVPGQVENDMVLGTSSYQNGLRATAPNLRPTIDAGIGILKGATPIPLIVKVAYLNMIATERVAKRARALREAAGTLSGVAIGDVDADLAEVASLLDDLNVVYVQSERADRAGVWSEELCSGLAELRPDVYAGWTPDTLAAALKPYAIRTVQLHMPDADGVRRTRYGLRRELLNQALAVRAERRALEPS